MTITPCEHNKQGHCLLAAYLEETCPGKGGWRRLNAKDYQTGRAILKADQADQISVLFAAFELPAAKHIFVKSFVTNPLIQDLFRRGLVFSEQELELLCLCWKDVTPGITDFDLNIKQWLVRSIEKLAAQIGLSETLRNSAEAINASLEDTETRVSARKLQAQIEVLLYGPPLTPLHIEEAWGAAVLSDWNQMQPERKSAWGALLAHALASDSTKPSAKWLGQGKVLMDAIGSQAVQTQIIVWLELYQTTPLPQATPRDNGYEDYEAHTRLMTLANHNYQAVKGLVWLCRCFDDVPTARLLGNVALHSLKKIPGHGPKSAKVGTACLLTLAAMSGLEPVAQLSRLKTRVTYQAALGVLDKALDAAAAQSGLTRDDLEELAVPDFGLDTGGRRGETLGDYQAEIVVTGTGSVELLWRTSEGKLVKSLPASIKREYLEELKSLKKTVTELQEVVGVQKSRLEDAMRSERTWTYAVWHDRYLSHPLLRLLSQRLIWQFGMNAGIVREGQIEDEHGRPLTDLTEDTLVKLWHPLTSDPDSVFAWRVRLEQLSVTQPFKQAHREVYLLTDAERTSQVYSNRFAAHILKQHQFSALCRQRGWQYTLQGQWDSHNTPTLYSKTLGLGASFAVNGIETLLSESNIFLYVTTGEVEFFSFNTSQSPLSLDKISLMAFSEIMRDVDLFVGVCSVGNDPDWQDAARVAQGARYWNAYAFGDLGEAARTRADVLGRLLPRLKIASRCQLDGKFLTVRGDLRTYKIHLGSGNILIEPNDQYLCIVPGRSEESSDLFLPFEGDRMLAIILSKAFLLADDKVIKDPTIVSQIKRAQS